MNKPSKELIHDYLEDALCPDMASHFAEQLKNSSETRSQLASEIRTVVLIRELLSETESAVKPRQLSWHAFSIAAAIIIISALALLFIISNSNTPQNVLKASRNITVYPGELSDVKGKTSILQPGTNIESGANGFASIAIANGTGLLDLGPKTGVRITANQIECNYGSIEIAARHLKKNSTIQIITPFASFQLNQGICRISNSSEQIRLQVLSGTVTALRADGTYASVPADQGLIIKSASNWQPISFAPEGAWLHILHNTIAEYTSYGP